MIETNDPMLEVYLFENTQLLEQLESLLLEGETTGTFSSEQIHEIFRILHTIKGSSAMMGFDNLTRLSHALEDLFAYLRDHTDVPADRGQIYQLTFEYEDFVRREFTLLQAGEPSEGDPKPLITRIESHYHHLLSLDPGAAKAKSAPAAPAPAMVDQAEGAGCDYRAVVFFEEDCKMENVRAFGVLQALAPLCETIHTVPEDLMSEGSADEIAANGLVLRLHSREQPETLRQKILQTFFLKSLDFAAMDSSMQEDAKSSAAAGSSRPGHMASRQTYMSVGLGKLDKLMNLVGEIVITEATVIKNPDALSLRSESFSRAARQLEKLTDELQDIVMSIRMVPVATAFHNMRRIVRDMSVKTGKKAELTLIGEETEADKNVIDNLAEPLMHIIRNSMDHGLEPEEERIRAGKVPVGRITLEARSVGGDVLILVSDDGRGLDRQTLLKKGREKGLLKKPDDEISDSEAYSLIFAPGFSTKEEVTEFSGRGVGMDAALQIIQKLGGSLSVDSRPGQYTTVQIRIPLTLAIIRGMQVSLGGNIYILPLPGIRECFRPAKEDIIRDPEGNEMILIRGDCYPVLHLNRLLGLQTGVARPEEGILVLVQSNTTSYCLLVDGLVGEHQTVVKPMPAYLSRSGEWIHHIAGCTLLGDGSISLVLDINRLAD